MPVCLSFLIVLFWSVLTLAWLKPCHCFLKSIQYCAALVILKRCETDHIAFLFQSLHWLPITQIIKYKINTLCYKCIKGTALSYICDCPQLYTPSDTLCSVSDTLTSRFLVPDFPLLSFSIFGPCTWNDLPLPLQMKTSLNSFKSKFKTFSKRAALPCFPCYAASPCLFSVF